MADRGPRRDREDVLAANAAFYDAFERADLDGLGGTWERTDRAVCTHPGWGMLRGWEVIEGSFAAIFRDGRGLQFIVTDVAVEVEGDTAWVTCDENLWGEGLAGTVAALNLFVRDPLDERWRMVAHHASPVPGPEPGSDGA